MLFSVCQFEHWGRTSAHKVSASIHHLIRLLTTDVFPFLYTSLHLFSVSINIFQYQGSLIQSQHALGEEGGTARSGRQSIRGLTHTEAREYIQSHVLAYREFTFNLIFISFDCGKTPTQTPNRKIIANQPADHKSQNLALVIIKLCCLKSFKCYVCVCICV